MNYTESNSIDVWKATIHNGEIDINLSVEQLKEFKNKFATVKCGYMIEDLQKLIDEEARSLETSKKDDSFFNDYKTYDQIVEYMTSLVNQYNEIMYMVNIGNTTQGRSIYAIEMNGGGDLKNKRGIMPTIYIQGLQHAREWVAPPTVLYILTKLAEGYGVEENITRYVDDINWVFVPVVNVDGYNFTRTNDRLWRKNRRPPPQGSTCYGVDTNRNWPSYWNRGGSSSSACSETYMGVSAASEVEVQTIMRYFSTLTNVVLSTDYHSYSQLYITPWAWSTQSPPHLSNMTALGNKAAAAIRAVDGKVYQVGSTAQILYVASGSFNDWQYDNYGIVYTQCIELRDTGQYGFVLPAVQILPTARENFQGVLVQAEQVLSLYPMKKK